MNEEISNLRPAVDEQGELYLRPVGHPAMAVASTTLQPLASVGGKLIAAGASTLCAIGPEGLAGMSTLGDLPGTPACALELSAERAVVMTDKGALVVDGRSTTPTMAAATVDYPALSLLAVDRKVLSAHVPSRTLKATGTGEALARSDVEAIIAAHTDAYLSLCSQASAEGLMLQPAVLRYRLLSDRGECLFTSAPLLLSHSTGAQCVAATTLSSADRSQVDGYDLTASVWGLRVACPATTDAAALRVARVDVYMTPLFHPCDTRRRGTLTLARGDNADVFARVTLPGREYGLSSLFAVRGRRMLADVVAHLDECEQCVASISRPFGAEAQTLDIAVGCSASPADDIARLNRALAATLRRPSFLKVMMSRPHAFVAERCAAAGNAVMWAAPSSRPYVGYSVAMMAAMRGSGAWRAVSVVKFDGGRGVVRSEQGSDGAPLTLSPLLTYPSPEARELTVIIYHSGQNHKLTVPLTPDASGRCAYYLSPDFKPISPAAASPTQDVGVQPYVVDAPGCVAVAPASSPLDIAAVFDTELNISALAGRQRRQQSWEFGRSHFLAAGPEGVHQLSVSADLARLSVRRLSGVGAEALCTGFDGECYVLVGGALMLVDSTGRLRPLPSTRRYTALGFAAGRRELWCAHAAGVDVFFRDHDMRRAARTDVLPVAFYTLGGELYGRDIEGIHALEREVAASQAVRIVADIHAPHLRHTLAGTLQANMVAGSIVGTLTVEGTCLDRRRPAYVRGATINGALRSPLRMLLPTRKLRGLTVTLAATVSSDFIFKSLSHNIC